LPQITLVQRDTGRRNEPMLDQRWRYVVESMTNRMSGAVSNALSASASAVARQPYALMPAATMGGTGLVSGRREIHGSCLLMRTGCLDDIEVCRGGSRIARLIESRAHVFHAPLFRRIAL
jgi:hypothetical protein